MSVIFGILLAFLAIVLHQLPRILTTFLRISKQRVSNGNISLLLPNLIHISWFVSRFCWLQIRFCRPVLLFELDLNSQAEISEVLTFKKNESCDLKFEFKKMKFEI